jgi:hypothetical protein
MLVGFSTPLECGGAGKKKAQLRETSEKVTPCLLRDNSQLTSSVTLRPLRLLLSIFYGEKYDLSDKKTALWAVLKA